MLVYQRVIKTEIIEKLRWHPHTSWSMMRQHCRCVEVRTGTNPAELVDDRISVKKHAHRYQKLRFSDVDRDQRTEISNLPDIAIDIDISILP